MKRLLLLALLVLVPSLVMAASVVRTGESVSVATDQEVEGDFYGVGSQAVISGSVTQDLILAGGDLKVNGNVGDDLLAIGAFVDVGGTIGDDVRVVGFNVSISGEISGNLMVVANNLQILPSARIGGDVLFFGASAEVAGEIGGDVMGTYTALRLDGTVSGAMDVRTTSFVLGERADINGSVRYESLTELVRAQGSTIGGVITRSDVQVDTSLGYRTLLIQLLVTLFATLVLYLLLPSLSASVAGAVVERPLRAFALGFGVLFLTPVIALILFVTTLGSILAVWVLLAYFTLLLMSLLMAGIVVGYYLVRLSPRPISLNAGLVAIGVVLIHTVLTVPVVGGTLVVALLAVTLGALAQHLFFLLRS